MNVVRMMQVSTFAVLTTLASLTLAAESVSPELFGIKLKGATRVQMRQALKQAGVAAIREDDRFWVDTYNPAGKLKEATDLAIGYVDATGEFAQAHYTFKSFMDSDQVSRIIDLVSSKYGRPKTRNGNPSLGEVNATWKLPGGMSIIVERGWPDTTTHLYYRHTVNYQKMDAEIAANRRAQEQQQQRQQSGAF